MHWYTADTHFNHDSIIKFCNRPFESSSEMDDAILGNLRRKVGPKDDLWLLGDFAFGRGEEQRSYVRKIFCHIPGRKHLVIGNHDKKWIRDFGWHSVHDLVEVKDSGQKLVLCHYPLLTWPGVRHGALQLFGHVHSNFCGFTGCVNVGADLWNYVPVSLPEISMRSTKLPDNPMLFTVEPGMEGNPSVK